MKTALLRSLPVVLLVVALASIPALAGQAPQGKPQTIRGRIAAMEKGALKVTTSAGDVLVKYADDVRIGAVEAAKLSDIKDGSYVGATAAKQSDGTLKALEVHIFPESARGTGEGHRPWDLEPGSTMTNANVEKIESATVNKAQGQVLTMKYKDGEQKIFVPSDAPIVKNVAGDRSMLKTGAGVYIPAVRAEDGSLTASRITVGINGIMPPM
jgi:hypothetical protein